MSMHPNTRRMIDLGFEILKLSLTVPSQERDGWFHFFSSAWGYLPRSLKLGDTEELLRQYETAEFWDQHMESRRRG
jgi:hypothetical protein